MAKSVRKSGAVDVDIQFSYGSGGGTRPTGVTYDVYRNGQKLPSQVFGIEIKMSNDQKAAIAALRDFLSAMRDWESHYYELYRPALSNAGAAKLLGVEMCNAKRAIIARWCSPEVLARASTSPSVGDPPKFDPDRDSLNIQEVSENVVVVEHIQRARLESQHRFRMVSTEGRWVVEDVDVLEDDLPARGGPMIL